MPSLIAHSIRRAVPLGEAMGFHKGTRLIPIQQCPYVLLLYLSNSIAGGPSTNSGFGMNSGNQGNGGPRGTFKPFAPTTVLVVGSSNR